MVLLTMLGFQLLLQKPPEPRWAFPSSSSLTSFSVTQLTKPTRAQWTHQMEKTPRAPPTLTRCPRRCLPARPGDAPRPPAPPSPSLGSAGCGESTGLRGGLVAPEEQGPLQPTLPPCPARRTAPAVPVTSGLGCSHPGAEASPAVMNHLHLPARRPTPRCERGC